MKKELRSKYLLIRKNIPNRYKLDEIIYQKVINHPKVKKDARKVINITAKNMRKKALRAGASNGAMSTLKFGFSKLLKLIF